MTEIRVTTDGGVARTVFAGPATLNALTPSTLNEVVAVCDRLAQDPSVRLVCFEGEAGSFSAGANLPSFSVAMQRMPPEVVADLGRRAANSIAELPQITVAIIDGYCIGGGLVLAGACDVRLASDTAQFKIPELDAGIPLAWGGLERLCALVGETTATDWVLTCRMFDAEEARQAGLLTRVIPSSRFEEEARDLVEQIARRPAIALRFTKQQLYQLRTGRFDARTDAAALLSAMADPEAAEIARRYVEAKIKG